MPALPPEATDAGALHSGLTASDITRYPMTKLLRPRHVFRGLRGSRRLTPHAAFAHRLPEKGLHTTDKKSLERTLNLVVPWVAGAKVLGGGAAEPRKAAGVIVAAIHAAHPEDAVLGLQEHCRELCMDRRVIHEM